MNFFHTNISKQAITEVTKVLRKGFISAGEMAENFEFELTKKLGITNPVTLNSGTSALHLALCLAGVGKGNEVILPPQTFIATGMVILQQGAKPVFADIQPGTGNIDPESIERKITKKTKAIIPVHWGGYPCDLDEINEIAKINNITVIEDAAHALGAFYKGKPIGSISRFTAFSFQAIKHLTTGDGGALCCRKKNDFTECKKRRWFDIDREKSKMGILGEREYNATDIGFKYHMNDIAASIGLGNIKTIGQVIKRHREIAKYYSENLKNFDGITFLNYKEDRISSYWFYPILVKERNRFVKSMKSKNIPVSVVHRRIDKNRVFRSKDKLINQDYFDTMQIALPVNCGMNEKDLSNIIKGIKSGW